MKNETKSKVFAYSATAPVVGFLFGLVMSDIAPSFPQDFILCGFFALAVGFFLVKIDRLLTDEN
jgi:hypothetical protein